MMVSVGISMFASAAWRGTRNALQPEWAGRSGSPPAGFSASGRKPSETAYVRHLTLTIRAAQMPGDECREPCAGNICSPELPCLPS